MANAFLKFINISISASWLALVVVILRLSLKKAPKWLNPVLWGIVGLRLVLPFSIESILSLIPSTETISPEILYSQEPAIHSGIPALNSLVNPIIAESFAVDPAVSANPLQIWIPIAAVVWAVGIAVMLIYMVISYLNLSGLVRTSVSLRDNIYQSENVASPFVLGILRPRIYLPFNMDEKNISHVIAHEQTHIKRRDHWIKPFGFLLLALYWFNPVLWVAYILLCRDIELACDQGVIKALCADQRADYSDALLARSGPRRMIDACPLAFGEIGVKQRVKNVLNYKKPAFRLVIVAVVICIVVAVCFLTNPKKAPIPFSTMQITWANALDIRPNEPTSYKLNDAEIGELKDRLRDLEIGRKNNDYGGFTPVYSLSIKAQGMEQFMIASYNSDGTRVGLMYKGEYYRIENDDFSRYLSNICAGGGRAEASDNKGRLSLNDVMMLSEKGEDLSWEDFEQFSYAETGSGLYIRVYEINPLFSLWIGGDNPDNEPMYIMLRANTEPEDAIDIRTEDAAAFIGKHSDDPDDSPPPVSEGPTDTPKAPNEDMEIMPGGLPRVYSENNELNKAFIHAKPLPDVYWETDNKTNLPKEGADVSIPSGRPAFAFLPTRPREERSIFIDEATLKQIISEIAVAKVLPNSSRIDWAQADFQDYWLNLYVLTDGNVYNRIELWGPIRHKKDVYVDISVMSVDSMHAFETWRIESSALGQILIDTWGPKFDLQRLRDVTRIDMRVLDFYDGTKVGNKTALDGNAAKDMAKRMLETAKIVTGYGKCGYNIELCFTFSDNTTEIGWLNGDSCTGIAMDNGPNIMFDKEITRELYKLLDYGEDFIPD